MAEFITDADGTRVAAATVYDDPDVRPPDDDVLAPKGWAWNRAARQWKPRLRTPAGQSPPQQPQQQAGDTPGPAGPEPLYPDVPRDPDPAHMAQDSAGNTPGTWDPSAVSRETRNEIEGMLGLFYSIPADFLITADPYCFGILQENLDATIAATVPIICRSRLAVEFVCGASGLVLWIKLMATLKPFLVAVWQHHVTGQVEVISETDDEGNKTGNIKVLKQDFSQYTAA